MRAFDTPRARIALVAATFAALFVLRLLVEEPGPLLLLPVLLAGAWFGSRGGLAAAATAAAIYAVTRGLMTDDDAADVAIGTLIRLVVYGVAGAVVGHLTDQ